MAAPAQTLVTLPALTTPITVTQANTLAQNVAMIQNLDNRMTLALSVLAKAYELQAGGGTDYRTNIPQLRIDATSLFGGTFNIASGPYGAGPMGKIQAVLDWNAGFVADATLPTDVNALVVLMGNLRETPETTLLLFMLFLDYKLSLI